MVLMVFLALSPLLPKKRGGGNCQILIEHEIFDYFLINNVDLDMEDSLSQGLKAAAVKLLYRGAKKYCHKQVRAYKRVRNC